MALYVSAVQRKGYEIGESAIIKSIEYSAFSFLSFEQSLVYSGNAL